MADTTTTSKMKKRKRPDKSKQPKDTSPRSVPPKPTTTTLNSYHRAAMHLPLIFLVPILYTLLHIILMPSPRPLLSRAFLLPLFTLIITSALADVHWTHKRITMASNEWLAAALNDAKTAYAKDCLALCRHQNVNLLAMSSINVQGLEDKVRLLELLGASGGKGSGSGKRGNRTGAGMKGKADTGSAMPPSIADEIAATEERIRELKRGIAVAEKVKTLFEREDLGLEEMGLLLEREEEISRSVMRWIRH